MQESKGRPAPFVEAVQGLHAAVADAVQLLDERLPAPKTRTGRSRFGATPIHEAVAATLVRLPGFLAQFDKTVPPSHLEYPGVRCVCGAGVVAIEPDAPLVQCGGCDRTFLAVGSEVRVARWERTPLEDRYAGDGWTDPAVCA
jgi:hypothetical protein